MLVFSAFAVTPVLLRARVTTVPELLGRRFDDRMRRYLSSVSIVLSIFLDTAGSLYAGALVIRVFFPALELTWCCVAIAVFAGIYTAAGGLRAVVYTDVFQSVILLIGSLLLAVLVFGEFDYSLSAVQSALGAEKLSLIRPADDPYLPWPGTLIGLPILGFYYWTMNQYVSQRILGARSIDTAARGAMLAAGLKLLPLFIMVFPGAMAAALFTDIDRADTIFPRLIAEFAPAGLAGLILAGLISAIMSSVDSALNSASTLISVDFVQPHRPHMTSQQLARSGRYITLILMVVAAVWAPMIDNFPGLFAYLQQGFTYAAAPLVPAFLLAIYSRGINADAAFFGTLTGHAFSGLCFVAVQLEWITLHFTIMAGVLVVFSTLAIMFFQWRYQRLPSLVQLAVVATSDDSSRHHFPADIRWMAALIIAAIVWLLSCFW